LTDAGEFSVFNLGLVSEFRDPNNKETSEKGCHVWHKDSDICKQFLVRIEDPSFDDLFQPNSSLASK